MTSGTGSNTIPGTGTFFVGIDIAPGRYRCDDGKGGWWVRFTGPGGDAPVGSWPLPEGPIEVEIEPTDFAFETQVRGHWWLVAPASSASSDRRPPPEPRPVADPTLRAELDGIVASRRSPRWTVPAVVTALFLTGGVLLSSLWLLLLTLPAAMTTALGVRISDDLRRARALGDRRDRYLEPENFDEEGRALLARVQQAIRTIQESQVNREGLLDTVDNAVTLPRQEWEIAQALARQSRLRRDERELAASAVPEVAAAMRPLHHKLELSVQAVTRRVEALERYAERARAADEALRAHRQLERLAERSREYDELLADTVRDELALPAIERLSDHSEALLRTLRSRLAEAAEAGGDLPPPSPGGSDG